MAVCLWVLGLCAGLAGEASPYEREDFPMPPNAVDRAVLAQLTKQGISPALPASDAVFVRRVFLDVIGTLPTAQEARQFLENKAPDKRRVLIDQLLNRDEFADYWAMKWGELLRVKAEFPINLWPNAVQAYHRWIRTSVRDNLPYDQFARELLTASGSNFRVGQVNFYRAMQNRDPQGIAQTVALTFMGCRAEKWPTNRLAGMAAFFSQVGYKSTGEWKEEIVFFDPGLTTNGLARNAALPDGTPARLGADKDPREVFADWLIREDNPWFARNAANRVWSWLLGRGVVHEPDDLRPDNPPSNPALLALLEKELIGARYDLKHLFRLILNSRTYQQSALPAAGAAGQDGLFARYPVRRLEAEVLIDALNQITGSNEKYSSAIPEPYTFVPENQRAIALADASISSPFLELFGRPARDTGLEAERATRATAPQRLHLLNSSHIQKKIEQSGRVKSLAQARQTPRETARRLYLEVLSRWPTEAEAKVVEEQLGKGAGRGPEAVVDLVWALVNSTEFLSRH